MAIIKMENIPIVVPALKRDFKKERKGTKKDNSAKERGNQNQKTTRLLLLVYEFTKQTNLFLYSLSIT
ncbi:MAG: hypothetical protein LLF80_01055 [Porphyromonadaceae bacterium]|nr:hypothetical protein [Porphyromonadaceae bacterium]